jgi:hypothetical protein
MQEKEARKIRHAIIAAFQDPVVQAVVRRNLGPDYAPEFVPTYGEVSECSIKVGGKDQPGVQNFRVGVKHER